MDNISSISDVTGIISIYFSNIQFLVFVLKSFL